MDKRRSMTRNKNHDDASSTKMIKTCDLLSNLNHDVLLLVIMQLGVVDFLAFGGVCKSWRSLALSNRNKFMVSKAPMSMCISGDDDNEKKCCLDDFEGRKLKTLLPHSTNRTCIGVTCGYLILFGKKTHDFWLVNPITRHELHFPNVPFDDLNGPGRFKAILVFSPSISNWVLVMSDRVSYKIWVSIVGNEKWTNVSSLFRILDLHAFKGKIYTLVRADQVRICEMRLYPKPQLVLLETESFPMPHFILPGFVTSGENLYVMDWVSIPQYKIHEINIDKMKWVSREKTGKEYAFFLSYHIYKQGAAVTQAWVDTRSLYKKYGVTDEDGRRSRFFFANMWYFFSECLNVNLLHE